MRGKKLSEDLVNLAGLDKQKTCITNPDKKLTNTVPISTFYKSKAGKKIDGGKSSILKTPCYRKDTKTRKILKEI